MTDDDAHHPDEPTERPDQPEGTRAQGGKERVEAKLSSVSQDPTDTTVGSGSDTGAQTKSGFAMDVPGNAQEEPEDPRRWYMCTQQHRREHESRWQATAPRRRDKRVGRNTEVVEGRVEVQVEPTADETAQWHNERCQQRVMSTHADDVGCRGSTSVLRTSQNLKTHQRTYLSHPSHPTKLRIEFTNP